MKKQLAITATLVLAAALMAPAAAFAQTQEGQPRPCRLTCEQPLARGLADGTAAIRGGMCAAYARVAGDQAAYGKFGFGWVDADGDGVCDNRGSNGRGLGWIDSDADGVCDNTAGARGMGWVDADADGVCDNRGSNGRGLGWIDADNDGVCDNRDDRIAGNGAGSHCGHGSGFGRTGASA